MGFVFVPEPCLLPPSLLLSLALSLSLSLSRALTRRQAEYVWIGGGGWDMRSKCRTLDFKPTSPDQLPLWNYDGSSTEQAPGTDSEVLLKPQAIFKDPFRGKNSANATRR